MSRLVFKDTLYEENDIDTGSEEDDTKYTKKHPNKDKNRKNKNKNKAEVLRDTSSSYELYGFDDDGHDSEKRKPSKSKSSSSSTSIPSSPKNSNGSIHTTDVKIHSRKRPRDDAAPLPVSSSSSVSVSTSASISASASAPVLSIPTSSSSTIVSTDNYTSTKMNTTAKSTFLSKFLSQSRTSQVCPPPDYGINSAVFIQEFFEGIENRKLAQDNNEKEKELAAPQEDSSSTSSSSDDEKSDSEGDEDSEDNNDDDIMPAKKRKISSSSDATQASLETIIAVRTAPAEVEVAPTLKLFNLPYRFTEDQLKQVGKKHGVEFVEISFDVDAKSGLPAGSAIVTLQIDSDVHAIVSSLQGEDCGGRPLRVHAKSNDQFFKDKRRLSVKDGSRYFGIDTSVKCTICAEIGHRTSECRNTVIQPCHLCAGRDHEAGDCPNITCFRCGQFGHHSRVCNNVRMQRHVICSQCGSSTHDARHCVNASSSSSSSTSTSLSSKLDEDAQIKCMCCGEFGHAMCQSLPQSSKQSSKNIFCPNCGIEGHHVDFTSLSRNENEICLCPRMEAYCKFPQLLRDGIEGHANPNRRDAKLIHSRNERFSNIARSNFAGNANYIFPSLAFVESQSSNYSTSSNRRSDYDSDNRHGKSNRNSRGSNYDDYEDYEDEKDYGGSGSFSFGYASHSRERQQIVQPFHQQQSHGGNNNGHRRQHQDDYYPHHNHNNYNNNYNSNRQSQQPHHWQRQYQQTSHSHIPPPPPSLPVPASSSSSSSYSRNQHHQSHNRSWNNRDGDEEGARKINYGDFRRR